MELREALRQITDIRQQMAQSEVFRGYRSLTVGFSGAAAILAAAVQPHVVPSPQDNLRSVCWLPAVRCFGDRYELVPGCHVI